MQSRLALPLALVAGLSSVAACGGGDQSIPSPPVLDDVWVYDAGASASRRIATASGPGRESSAASISADGRRIVFQSDSDFHGEGIPNGTDEIWLYDAESDALSRVTSASTDERDSRTPSISADGRVVVFESNSDLLGTGLAAGQTEIWRYDIESGETTRLTEAPSAGGTSGGVVVSADGTVVAFHSNVDFESGRTMSNAAEIWLLNTTTGDLTRVTRAGPGGGPSVRPSIDAAGRRLAFESSADLLGERLGGSGHHLWFYDAASSELVRITPPVEGGRESEAPQMSTDGTRIVFHSDADLLTEGRPDSVDEIWLYDVPTSSLRRLTSTWAPPRDADLDPVLHPDSQNPRLTADGSKVVFASDADFLGEGVPNGYPHVWVYNLEDDGLSRIDTSGGSGSGMAIDAKAGTVVLYRTAFDQIRNARVSPTAVAAGAGPPRPEALTAEQLSEDLDAFQRELEERWAYLKASGVDYRAAVAAVREKGADGMSSADYALELQRIISMFIDGHAGVSGVRHPPGYLPFLIEPAGDRFVAFLPDRSGFVDDEHPYLVRMDGRAISEWIASATPFNPRGAPQYRTRHALRQMRYLQFQRGVMGLEQADTLTVDVVSRDGQQTRELSLPVASGSPTYGVWPRTQSGLLDGNVGYLRLEAMNMDAVRDVAVWMPKFRDTVALVVDVRGNGGGSRDALRAVFPYVMAEDAEPRVVNAATYRMHPDYPEDHLGGSRYMYRESWDGWTPAERRAIEAFTQDFTPQWTPPADEFSEWHYLVMSRRTNPEAFVYGKPVIVLLDPKSFSATDIFVSAFKGHANVTLMGSPSGGGSARRVGVQLPVSRLSMGLASMASFQISGRLHDGNGTQPDVVVVPEPEYFLAGGEDNILQAALARIRATLLR